MKYSKYLKDLGMTRKDVFKLNHFGIRNELERIKYGTNYHEMWSLDVVLACEIYPKLKRLYDKYHYLCNFGDATLLNEIMTAQGNDLYDKTADERFQKVLCAFETIIKIYSGLEEEQLDADMFENIDSQYNKVKEGLKIFGEGFWGVGI